MDNHTILIVDDASEDTDMLFNLLKNRYKIKAATDGAKAIQIAGAHDPPDLILLDIVMPGLDGFEVCRKLKSDRKTKDIPVIFLTAATDMDSIVGGFEAGGVDYIIKPFRAVELTTRLKTHLLLKTTAEKLKNQNVILENMVDNRTRQLRQRNESLKEALVEKEELLHEALSMDVKLRESLDRLNKLYGKIRVIQEEERKKIAMEIHDRLGQLLTAIKLSLFQIRGKAESADEKLAGKIEAAIAMTDDAIKASQGLSFQLRPDILDNLGFLEAVTWYCRTMQETSGLAFTCEARGVPPALEKEMELSLYRVIQEAATNVLRHARAKTCRIEIEGTADFVRVRICDDGIGIDRDKINDAESLGIYGMRKRVDDIHGEFGIAGTAGMGTTITIVAPTGGEKS